MKQKLFSKVMAMLLVVVMLAGYVPVNAFATEIEETTGTLEETTTEVVEETMGDEEITTEVEEGTTETLEVVTEEVSEVAAVETVVEQNEELVADTPIKTGDKIGTNGYYKVLSKKEYDLVPGAATETEMVINNATNDRRQVLHIIEVDPSNPDVSIVPGYHQIDKDVTQEKYWSHKELTLMAEYYENNLGYNIVGGMNTDLYYDTYAPRILVYNGKDLSVKGKTNPSSSILYVFKEADGTVSCEVKAFNRTEFDTELASGRLLHAVGVSFAMVVKDGELVSKTEERTSSPAARSMVGVKPDGTLVICMNDGRGANNSVGLCNYEEGEIMLALGCEWAANCDGGGSSTFLTKRVGEENFAMRSVPCDGAQRPTAHGIFVASNVGPTGELDKVNITAEYDFFAPNTTYTFEAEAIDTHGYAMNMPNVTWKLSDEAFGTMSGAKFTSNGVKGEVEVQAWVGGELKGSKTITITDPDKFGLSATSTVIPYSTTDKTRTITVPIVATIGDDNIDVYYDTNAVEISLSNAKAGTLDGFKFTATTDTSIDGVDITVKYITTGKEYVYRVEFGKGSEVILDFENGDRAGFAGFEEAKAWSKENKVNNTLVGSDPLAGQFNEYLSSKTFIASNTNGGQVRNGNYSLAWKLDNTDAAFASWSYNVLFNIGETIVLRDVANGKKATTLGMWLYIPEGAPGLAFQSQFYVKNADGTYSCKQDHFMFTSAATGKQTNLNSATEADIPESRWVYASIDISKYDYLCTPVAKDEGNSRSPSFIRTYVKPTTPAELTFYIDDITLDYSSAVDDRVLPVISEPAYSTSDTPVVLENGATINGNKMAFTAKVSDNVALDNASATILVDGVKVKATVAGGYLSCEDITLTSGVHTVSFEIKDELGNPAKVTRTFTVAGNPVVTLTGHNDSGQAPKYNSIYYVDIDVADLSNIKKLTTELKLQNANTWETEGAVVTNGFKATFDYNDISEILTVTVEADRNNSVNGAGTLVSIPVRIWKFDRYNYVTETYYPESDVTQGNRPVVNVECSVVYGEITLADKTVSPFGGNIDVETELTTISSPVHFHDEELTILNKPATSTEAGYENRTYCETCQSVIDWGNVVEASGHNYIIVDGKFVCSDEDCDDVYDAGTGIFEMNDKLYYAFDGELQTGWQTVDEGYCYANPTTYEVYVGEKAVNGITYSFGENGILVGGAWVADDKGTRYSYGPGFYTRMWVEIGGHLYYFGRDSYMYTGIRYVKDNPDTDPIWYDFGEDGKVVNASPWEYTGLYEYNGDLYYIKEGAGQLGLQYIDGEFYYFESGSGFENVGYAARNKEIYVNTTNGLTFEDGTPVKQGTYYFDAEGKMVVKAGIIDGVYYENGLPVAYKGLVEQDGYYYYANDGGKIVKDRDYYVKTTNGLTFPDGTPIVSRTYHFDVEGKMEIKNGVVDGVYYENSKAIAYKGLVEQDGYYYYANDGGKVVKDRDYYVKTTNGLTFPDGTPIENRTYHFDAEGKMEIRNGIVDGVYYENSKAIAYKGLVEQDGYYYYANDGGKVVKDKDYYVKTTNGLTFPDGTPIENRTYHFDAEGRMEIRNGVVDGIYYENSKAIAYKGLVEQDGYYYYANDGGKVVKDRDYYVKTTNGLTFPDGTPIENRTYHFDAEGRMEIRNGVVDGIYYENSKPVAYKGLVEQDGDYYYANDGGKVVKDRDYYVKTTNGLTFPDGTPIESRTYHFDVEGKMVIE